MEYELKKWSFNCDFKKREFRGFKYETETKATNERKERGTGRRARGQ